MLAGLLVTAIVGLNVATACPAAAAGDSDADSGSGIGLVKGPTTTTTTLAASADPALVTALERARAVLAAARGDARVTASQFHAAEARLEEVAAHIDELTAAVDAKRAEERRVRDTLRDRARDAYSGRSLPSLDDGLDGDDMAMRRTRYLKIMAAGTSALVRRLDALASSLEAQRAELQQEAEDLETVRAQWQARVGGLSQQRERIRAAAGGVVAAIDALVAQSPALLTAELVDERDAASAMIAVASRSVGQVIVNRSNGPIQCPVAGTSYSDDFMRGRTHPGIDMMTDTGVPVVAVRAGSVSFVAGEGAGGNTAYLAGDDGTTYFYAHFSEFVGPGRDVVQGEVIGLVGSTGNATAPHLHFEIRPGGPGGASVNPYATLVEAGC